MITLEKEFISGVGGFSQSPGPLKYVQLDRTNGLPINFAVYQRFYADGKPKDFETFRIKIVPKGIQKFPGGASREILDDTERYAHTSEFGFTAWSFENEGAARWKFKKLATGNEINDDVIVDTTSIDSDVSVKDTTPSPSSSVKTNVKDLLIPVGVFKTQQLADHNNVHYNDARAFINLNLGTKIKSLGRDESHKGKGQKPVLFAAV
jgi:hypothetical protein